MNYSCRLTQKKILFLQKVINKKKDGNQSQICAFGKGKEETDKKQQQNYR
jgi:hypothetical protein